MPSSTKQKHEELEFTPIHEQGYPDDLCEFVAEAFVSDWLAESHAKLKGPTVTSWSNDASRKGEVSLGG